MESDQSNDRAPTRDVDAGAARPSAQADAPAKRAVISRTRARQATSSPMTARILLFSLLLIGAAFFAVYAIFAR